MYYGLERRGQGEEGGRRRKIYKMFKGRFPEESEDGIKLMTCSLALLAENGPSSLINLLDGSKSDKDTKIPYEAPPINGRFRKACIDVFRHYKKEVW